MLSHRSRGHRADRAGRVNVGKLHADTADDFPRCRQVRRRRGIKSRLARRGIGSSKRLGHYRWVVERTPSVASSLPLLDHPL